MAFQVYLEMREDWNQGSVQECYAGEGGGGRMLCRKSMDTVLSLESSGQTPCRLWEDKDSIRTTIIGDLDSQH